MVTILPRKFYCRNTEQVARNLLGKTLVRENRDGLMAGKIVETEAYYGKGDPASHAFRGKTPRSKIMWEQPGQSYVYFTYGMHFLFNVVTEKEGTPGAVLIRALEPLRGLEIMKKNRPAELKNLTNGPAKLTRALAITTQENRLDLTRKESKLYLTAGKSAHNHDIVSCPRIGISSGKESPLRFYIKGNKFVSRR